MPASGRPTLTLPQAIQAIRAAYLSNDWAQAQRLCGLVLGAHPGNFDALNWLGIIAARSGRTEEAADLFARAAAVNPLDSSAHNNRGNVLRELRRYDEALDCYERALAIAPADAEALHNRGLVLLELTRFDDANASFERALALEPGLALTHYGSGLALKNLGRWTEALAAFERASELRPDFAEAFCEHGNVLQLLGRHEDALSSYGRSLAQAPRFAQALNCRGIALHELRLFRDALEDFDHALCIDPRIAELHLNRGHTLQALGRLDAALAGYERAIELQPDFAEAHNSRGNVLCRLSRFEEAIGSYDSAAGPAAVVDWLCGNRLFAMLQICRWTGLRESLAAIVRQIAAGGRAVQPFTALCALASPESQRRAAEIFAAAWPAAARNPAANAPHGRRGRMIIGYYSADFHEHATALLMASLFESHDRRKFELVAFSFGPDRPGPMRARLSAAFDRFIDVGGASDREVARMSRDIGIDIAVDLKGYTDGHRMGIFANRAAPIQASYLGFPGTTGAPFMDYLIADRIVVPPENMRHFSEKLVYLPHSYYPTSYRSDFAGELSPGHAASRAEQGLPPLGFVFCCFNNVSKIVPDTFDGWMRILAAVEGSVLWLLAGNETAAFNLRREAALRGVAGERLVFARRLPFKEHLTRHRLAGLFLDTLPYNAHTTASDALWAGLPVLSRIGESFASRVAASLLHAVGLPELVATTPDEYESTAIGLARDPRLLAELRARLARNRLTMPLFDTNSLARHLEQAYESMIERHRTGLAPDDLQVRP